ncbi:Transposon TX1 uncharacterized 149 kDa protein ORF 2 [Takifugu flavidus]|uniref:Transposon TX1 uncharacterized 149 kDa protein ORF 2 n=1 Tax=Takifugu flavidus TaxID=433684 RepID=A0A5C6P249_9TELE|nr:Transposon TX1 uncharacterized 149 kDa protein ORF 2 [Takifugu flavidus]
MALASLLDSQVQGELVRSLIQDLTEIDAPSSFFFGLEKKCWQNQMIHLLFSSTGKELVELGHIRKRAVEFFSSLYESEYCRDDGLFDEYCGDLPWVSGETNSRLNRPLQLDELHAALLGMKRAVVTLLPKKGNLQEIKNWRPVSLLCTDYRILSKTLASRLREAMEQVIYRDQTYCVPDRFIVDNVHLIRDVLEVSRSLDVDTGLISLDQEKAFDRVEHEFLWKAMERVRRGVRQGCALSGMLYALSLQPLFSRIRASMDGLLLPSFHRKIVLFAYTDDIIIMVHSQEDIDILSNLTVLFNRLSAARVNWHKSEALAVGRGRTLVLNNLVASVLWHRLSCMEPPSGLLKQLQTRVLSFFWDDMHWVQQGVLYLPSEEGGQGLIHLASRTATFRIQFIQREPIVNGARLDVSAEAAPRLKAAVYRTRTLLLQHIVAVAGPDLTGAEAVDYGQGTELDCEDPFPEIRLAAHLGNLDSPLLRPSKIFSLQAVEKKTLYYDCVRVLNRRGLSNRNTSVWVDRMGGDGACPCWRVLYKPPLKKRAGDLQWRILHRAVALNALLKDEHCCVRPVP